MTSTVKTFQIKLKNYKHTMLCAERVKDDETSVLAQFIVVVDTTVIYVIFWIFPLIKDY